MLKRNKTWESILKKIEEEKENIKKLPKNRFSEKTKEYKERLKGGETLDELLPEVFALVSEASRRTVNMTPFPVQLYGGYVLHKGKIAEMKTGEGKTLVAVLPAYLNALTGKSVHIITVNDYLAKRDAEQTAKILEYLGMTVGCVLADMDKPARAAQYACDVTYITNNEAGFDYLRDNMGISKSDCVQKGLCYAIVDEIDSVLIDEARTPLIISGATEETDTMYKRCDFLASTMTRGSRTKEFSKIDALSGEKIEEDGDYIVNEKEKSVFLTELGTKKAEKFFGIKNLSDRENDNIRQKLITALRAHEIMHKDKDYIVRDGQVLIVDEFTGRIMDGRRFSDGLHQAIEAKENVEIKQENKTMATITFQNFFRKYKKLAGMTGTAKTEEKEFRELYKLPVISIPTNKPVLRKDLPDKIFDTKEEKMDAILREIKKTHAKNRPILVGTADIKASEQISQLLTKNNIPHTVLNAKNDALEAEIVAQAGQMGAVTIATNMAGRGTDIKLGKGVKRLGGLKILGTEHNESRRIDNQLRGRAGRQGDPGESQFFVSLEDHNIKLLGEDNPKQGTAPRSRRKLVQKAQRKIEDVNFGIRKELLAYDNVNDEQRELVYAVRQKIANGDDVSRIREQLVSQVVDGIVCRNKNPKDIEKVLKALIPDIEVPQEHKTKKKQRQEIKVLIANNYKKKMQNIDASLLKMTERYWMLRIIDRYWVSHLTDLEQLRHQVGFYAYGQKDPKTEYRRISYTLFGEKTKAAQEEIVSTLFRIQN